MTQLRLNIRKVFNIAYEASSRRSLRTKTHFVQIKVRVTSSRRHRGWIARCQALRKLGKHLRNVSANLHLTGEDMSLEPQKLVDVDVKRTFTRYSQAMMTCLVTHRHVTRLPSTWSGLDRGARVTTDHLRTVLFRIIQWTHIQRQVLEEAAGWYL